MLLQVQLTLLQKNFEGGGHWPPCPPLDPPLEVTDIWRAIGFEGIERVTQQ